MRRSQARNLQRFVAPTGSRQSGDMLIPARPQNGLECRLQPARLSTNPQSRGAANLLSAFRPRPVTNRRSSPLEKSSSPCELALQEKDYASQVFLQWFVSEQVEEEKNAAEILEQLKLIGDKPGMIIFPADNSANATSNSPSPPGLGG